MDYACMSVQHGDVEVSMCQRPDAIVTSLLEPDFVRGGLPSTFEICP